jgi:hypothetical protein
METLVVCRCSHTIVVHENGACSVSGCTCSFSRAEVLEDAIEILRIERARGREGSLSGSRA